MALPLYAEIGVKQAYVGLPPGFEGGDISPNLVAVGEQAGTGNTVTFPTEVTQYYSYQFGGSSPSFTTLEFEFTQLFVTPPTISENIASRSFGISTEPSAYGGELISHEVVFGSGETGTAYFPRYVFLGTVEDSFRVPSTLSGDDTPAPGDDTPSIDDDLNALAVQDSAYLQHWDDYLTNEGGIDTLRFKIEQIEQGLEANVAANVENSISFLAGSIRGVLAIAAAGAQEGAARIAQLYQVVSAGATASELASRPKAEAIGDGNAKLAAAKNAAELVSLKHWGGTVFVDAVNAWDRGRDAAEIDGNSEDLRAQLRRAREELVDRIDERNRLNAAIQQDLTILRDKAERELRDRASVEQQQVESPLVSPASGIVVSALASTDALRMELDGDWFIIGIDENDTMIAEAFDDMVLGLAGNDAVWGVDGDDMMYGGDGSDTLNGNQGNDLSDGGNGNDRQRGHLGQDMLEGSGGNDSLFGGADSDILNGGDGDDVANGSSGDDLVQGGGGNDTVRGQGGSDLLLGEAGNDNIFGHAGHDSLDGGPGNDTLTGGPGNDVLFGDAGVDVFQFGENQARDVVLDFEDGVDKLSVVGPASFADLTLQVDPEGTVVTWGDQGTVIVLRGISPGQIDVADFLDLPAGAEPAQETPDEQPDEDSPTGGGVAVDQNLQGTGGNDAINGGAGDDTLRGGAGNDTLDGGLGTDALYGDDGNDLLTDAGQPTDTNFGQLFSGGAGDDTLRGNSGRPSETFFGGPGNDIMTGGAGWDTFDFWLGDGADIITDFDAEDLLFFHSDLTRLDITLVDTANGTSVRYGNGGDSVLLAGFNSDQLAESSLVFF